MWLLALHLTNVRKFTARRASITGIGRGITVVSEANEFGKSTFFDALHALFFEKYGSAAKTVKSLQPYAGGAVEVAAEIETAQGRFLVEKRFLAKKMARIVRLPDQTILAQDDEAERWISQVLGEGGDGPAGLLWVRQGLIGLEQEGTREKALTDTRRDLLSSVAGEIDAMTGGRRMDKVMRRLDEDLASIATKTGQRKGPWKAAAEEAEALKAEHLRLSAQVAQLEQALTDRKRDEAQLERLDAPDARARREQMVQAAQTAWGAAQAHEGLVTAAAQGRDIAALQAKAAKAELDGFLAAIKALGDAQTVAQETATRATAAAALASDLGRGLTTAQQAQGAAETALKLARQAQEAARQQTEARRARTEAADLKTRIDKAEAARTDRDQAAARIKASVATADWLARAEQAAADAARLEAAALAQATTLSVTYTGAARVTLNNVPVDDAAPLVLQGEMRLDLPGIGQMVVTAPAQAADAAAAVAKARAHSIAHLEKAGATTIEMARTLAADRAEALRLQGLATAMLDMLAPDGVPALQQHLAELELLAAAADDSPLPAAAALMAAVKAAETTAEQATKALRMAQTDHGTAREAAIKAEAASDTAVQALQRAMAAAGPVDSHETRRADLLRAEARAADALKQAQDELDRLTALAPDMTNAKAELDRAKDAVEAAARLRSQVAERLAAVSAQIRTMAGQGIEERRDEAAGQLLAAEAIEAQFARRAAALNQLQKVLLDERQAAQETYFGPVQQELKPLLSILHAEAALSFDGASLLPTGLKRGQTEEDMANLSGGTREQIAILTRLAFARLFARQGRHMPIILDDALVYSDDDRIIRMFTALTRVAQDQQIIVFSCRQLAFQDLGGARPGVEISDA